MKQVSFGILIALAIGAGPVVAQQASAGVSTGRAKVCRDSKGAAYSTGALLKAADGSIDRCEDGEWIPAPASATGAPQQTRGQGSQTSGQGQQSARRSPEGEAANVRLELTITDQSSAGQPVRKTISMLLANGFDGRVRSSNVITDPSTSPARYQVQLNADATVQLIGDDKIRTRITVEYSALRPGAAPQRDDATPVGVQPASGGQPMTVFNPPSGLNETVTVILASGKSTVITQSADPASERKVTLEATATIVR